MISLKKLNKKKGNQFYQQPLEIGRFSLDGNRTFHHDNRQMSHFAPPKTKRKDWKHVDLEKPFDLNHGYRTNHVQKDPDKKSNLKTMLNWMVANKSKFYPSKNKRGDFNYIRPPKIVTNRGYITKIMLTNYECRDDWMLVAQKFNGIIYVNDVETELRLEKRKNSDERLKRMQYWGHKFEKYVTEPSHGGALSAEEKRARAVNTNEAYFSVVASRFGDHVSVVIGAETDCVAADRQNAPHRHVELKTSREITCKHHRQNFLREKALKWWAQSFLCGTPTLVCGFRDDRGVVKSLERYEVRAMPEMARKEVRNAWSPVKCVNLAGNVLAEVVRRMEGVEEANTCLVVTWKLKSEFIEMKLVKDCEHAFLPDWFTEEMGK